ncbi:TPA: hypothetical protein DF272_06595 [Candidatus Falkowbacteria bacterium]|nr:hypothetical protein [Candidatus Falkowbacteria bacterium]
MRVAIISDIHGNLPALEAVLAEIRRLGVDFVACTGDIVGYGPWVVECVQMVRDRCRYVVKGNHDDGLIYVVNNFESADVLEDDFNPEATEALKFAALRFGRSDLQWLNDLPEMVVCSELSMSIAHGSFSPPYLHEYVLTVEAAKYQLLRIDTVFGVMGHSHLVGVFIIDLARAGSGAHIFDAGERFLVNAGSVGQPRDGNPQASFVIINALSDGRHKVELRRVDYDIDVCAMKIVHEGLPGWNAFRLKLGM